ncbi:ABC transporter substrate-binding protein [Rhizobium oryziradicis]|uniref:ABC transporter substrate-binding protein n=1 Tax=Rhizobium oryziradicis TaxID=1867956 RepID=A0A1Q8ZPF1_9HYPH|nr:ABC transporter substrate-binding protein [Rhizobium oryziradicis]OLP43752.1 ABC transporter substrate-binding protein [Rhizobium oryziradicis]
MKNLSFSRLLCLGLALMLPASMAGATDYPLTVTDLAGRSVEIGHEPKRIVLQDGRDLFSLALLDRADPFKRIVVWNNLLARSDKQAWSVFESKWPQSANQAVDMRFGDEGQVNLEQIVAAKPDLVIVQARVKPVLDDANVTARLKELGIPVVMIDTQVDPAVDAPKTVTLLGKVLNREKEAQEFADFYESHLNAVETAIAGAPKPKVFVEAKAGQKGLDTCCFTHGDVFFGKLAQAAGGINLGSSLLKTRTGDVTMESVISAAPDVFVMSGSPFTNANSVSPPLGFTNDKAKIEAALGALEHRQGFDHIKAITDGRVIGLYHQLYASPWNIFAIEYMAKAFYPERLKDLHPDATLHTLVSSLTDLPKDTPLTFGVQAPTVH